METPGPQGWHRQDAKAGVGGAGCFSREGHGEQPCQLGASLVPAAKTLEKLTSEEGALLRMNRSIQVEGVFGVLKEDYGFRRFLTRGKKNIETQFFLLAFAFNIQKLCNRIKTGRFGLDLFPLKSA